MESQELQERLDTVRMIVSKTSATMECVNFVLQRCLRSMIMTMFAVRKTK